MNQLNIDLRNEWRQLSTPDLEALLRAELDREVPDDDKVLTLLHILEDREPDKLPELTEHEQRVFERYIQRRVSGRKKQMVVSPRWLSVAASIGLILTLLLTVMPQQAEAETFWEMLQRMSNSVIEFFSREDNFREKDYVFVTDNPGLQQVYDAVVELGVTEPVVPMWLPEVSEILFFEAKNTPMSKGIIASFLCNGNEIVYKLDLYEGEPAHQYYKDDSHYETYEQEGATFHISRNNDRWSVVWTIENIECSIFMDCREDTLRRILKSIYEMEE